MKSVWCVLIILAMSCPALAVAQQAGNEATVVVMYPMDHPAMPRSPIYIDGSDVAHLKPDHFFQLTVSPGEHSFAGRNQHEGAVCRVEGGMTYFFIIAAGGGEGLVLSPTSEEVAKYDMKYLSLQSELK